MCDGDSFLHVAGVEDRTDVGFLEQNLKQRED
jgi:hypothetical protein